MAVAADYSGWVKDLDAFKPSMVDDDDDEEDRLQEMSAQYGGKSHGKKGDGGSTSQLEEIKQEMKLLNWHKLANEAALKAALIKTKKLKREDARQSSLLDAEERMERLQQIEEEENMKPLEVTAEFIRKYEDEERREERRLEADVARHISCLKKLKGMLEERDDQRRRHIQYREGKLALDHGYTLRSNQEDDKVSQLQLSARSTGNTNDVARVLSSLDKLVELERRISCLEQEDVEPASVATVAPLIRAAKETLKFTKTTSGRTTAQTVKKSKTKTSHQTFLTGVPEPKTTVKKGKMATTRMATASAIPVSTTNKSKDVKRAADLRRMSERDRHKALKMDKKQAQEKRMAQQNVKIDQWAEKKKQAAVARKVNYVKANQQQAQAKTKSNVARGKPTTANKHMDEFQAMKRGFEAKKAARSKTTKAVASAQPPPQGKKRPPAASTLQPWGTKPKPPTEQRLLPMIHGRVKAAGTSTAPSGRPPARTNAPTELPKVVGRPAKGNGDSLGLGIRGIRSG
ncbi:Aste57867_23465 [Aphanomyces stellatus]|uniref:Aste57867_23465 protein n=1 Tax=Aphanomyces stellatus TaxID=120398 RepID=A0A485LSC6_9STRA|nr:hypothetical protein As57867_023394 [Aphanomyces stellatus]VFU00110.1 Aste57867_23465 [Aphanomyces stellatus]